MQFMPATWKAYGVDGNQDGLMDPDNPVDAIFAAARYLKAAGADKDIRGAVFAYNHADWYVDSVLLRAQVIGGLPANLVGSLTGLTEGRFPVAAKATYADEVTKRSLKAKGCSRGREFVDRNGISIYADAGSPVVAVSDSRVVKIGVSKRLGNFVQVQDAYGNTYTYGRLAKVSKLYAAPKPQKIDPAEVKRMLALPKPDAKPKAAASDTDRPASRTSRRARTRREGGQGVRAVEHDGRRRPSRWSRSACSRTRRARTRWSPAAPSRSSCAPAGSTARSRRPARSASRATRSSSRSSRPARRCPPGTVLGRIGRASSAKHPHVRFEIRPAGRGAPRIDPKPILDGWKLLESTAIYRAKGKNPFVGPDAATPTIGQILLMSKETLIQRVLADPRVQIYDCGRQDIKAGAIDRRVLATIEFLVASGFNPTITSLELRPLLPDRVGQRLRAHAPARAVDIAADQRHPDPRQPGQGLDHRARHPAPADAAGHDEAASDHLADGLRGRRQHARRWPTTTTTSTSASTPQYGTNSKLAKQLNAVLKPSQWSRLIERLGEIENPTVQHRTVQGGAEGQDLAQGPVTEDRRFRFVQWEFAGRLGPPPGRYVVRRFAGDDVREVVVVSEAEAPRRRGRPARAARNRPGHARDGDRRRGRRATRPAPTGWLRRRGEATLAQFLAAHRVAAADPTAPGPGPRDGRPRRNGSGDAGRRGRVDRGPRAAAAGAAEAAAPLQAPPGRAARRADVGARRRPGLRGADAARARRPRLRPRP